MDMRKLLSTTILTIITVTAFGQWSVTPLVGVSVKGMTQVAGMENGGSAFFGGVETEYGFNRLVNRSNLTIMTGISYLDIDYSNTTNFSFAEFIYHHYTTSTNTQYVQVPLMIKLNWQPSPLIEHWVVFLGLGVSANFVMKSTIEEEATTVNYFPSETFPPPPTVEQYEDSRDVTDLGESMYLFRRIELGTRFKKFHFALRFTTSLKDMYHHELEGDWAVPEEESMYMRSHNANGKIKERYIELAFGYVLWPGKKVRQQIR
jgi:hypothetical protein